MRLTPSEVLEAIRILTAEPSPCDERVDRLLELAQRFKACHTNLAVYSGTEPSGSATYFTLHEFIENNGPYLSAVELNDLATLDIGQATTIHASNIAWLTIKRVQ